MEVDGILEDVRDITNNDFMKDGQVIYPYSIKVCRRRPRILSTT